MVSGWQRRGTFPENNRIGQWLCALLHLTRVAAIQRKAAGLFGKGAAMREIPLNSRKHPGMVALVDDDDYDRVATLKWHPLRDGKGKHTFYARSQTRNHKTLLMHRIILGLTDPKQPVDHENHNGLDNRRSNIHVVTHRFNMHQATKVATYGGRTPSSQFKGVSWHKWHQKWVAQSSTRGNLTHCGDYAREEDAAIAFDDCVIGKLGLEAAVIGAVLNFPKRAEALLATQSGVIQ